MFLPSVVVANSYILGSRMGDCAQTAVVGDPVELHMYINTHIIHIVPAYIYTYIYIHTYILI
jgi:hypothetical protein